MKWEQVRWWNISFNVNTSLWIIIQFPSRQTRPVSDDVTPLWLLGSIASLHFNCQIQLTWDNIFVNLVKKYIFMGVWIERFTSVYNLMADLLKPFNVQWNTKALWYYSPGATLLVEDLNLMNMRYYWSLLCSAKFGILLFWLKRNSWEQVYKIWGGTVSTVGQISKFRKKKK